MAYRLSFTSRSGGGVSSAASETNDKRCAETASQSPRSDNKFAAMQERIARNRRRLLGICRCLGTAALVSLTVQVALAQAGSPLSGSALAPGRLTIVNPQHQEVPEDRVGVLLLTTCRVVAQQFHRHPNEVELKLTLVIGDRDEHSMIDHDGHITLYLERWSEGKFVNGVITGAIQMLTPLQTRKKIWLDVRRRSDRIAPVSVNQLLSNTLDRPSTGVDLGLDCFSAAYAGTCPWPNRTLPHH